MQTRKFTVPTTSTFLKVVWNKVLPSVLVDEITESFVGIFPDAVLIAVFICIFVAIVAIVRGKPAVGRKLLAPGCDLGASLLPVTLNLNQLFLLIGLARTSIAILRATRNLNAVFGGDLRRGRFVKRDGKQLFGGGFYGWQLTKYLKSKEQAKLNSAPIY